MIKPSYSQTTCESCLPVCLLSLVKNNFTQKEEMKLFVEGLKKDKETYAIGIVDYFAQTYRKRIKIVVDNKIYFKFLSQRLTRKVLFINIVRSLRSF